ncbi:MAG: hypothetical protein MR451_05620 [Clostridiales bacterium]|nr:hypothetical protein [Clostridiales bacterium]
MQMTYAGQTGTTDDDGMVTFSSGTADVPLVTATLDGYLSWSNENSTWTKSETRYETIVLYPKTLSGYRLKICRYSNASDFSFPTDLLTQTKTLRLKNTGNLVGDLDFGYFYLSCQAVQTDKISSYVLRQGDETIAQCEDGNFDRLSVTWFRKGGGVTVRVYTTDEQTVDTPINLQFAENPVNKEWKLSLMDSITLRVPDGIPFLGGNEFKIGLDALPVDLKASESGFYVGFNVKFDDDEKDPLKEVKKSINTARKYGSMPVDVATAKKMKRMMKTNKGLALPGADCEVTVIGYAEFDWSGAEGKGELYLLVEAQTKTFGFNTVVVVVPVTVQVKGSIEAQLGGEILYNINTNHLDGGLKFEIEVGLSAFGGVGAGKVLGVGTYGQAAVSTLVRFLNTQSGVEKVDLTGELGLKAYCAKFTWERAFAKNTWRLYTANTVQAQSVDTESVLFDLYDAAQYTVESLDDLRDESAWQGDAVSLFAADANTSLTPLLEQTYRNAQPTLAVAGDTLYAAFLRGDAETNHVAVCVSKFTGSGWTDPVRVDETAILDDAPTLCAADGTLWLAYALTTEAPNGDLLTYAQKQSIVVGKLDPETLSLTDQAVYPGQGFAHLQTMTVVDGQPVLV